MNHPLLICPNCRQSLESESRAMRCASGHSFDVAREGYVNLLGGAAVKGLAGDSAEMVAARRKWLARGHYEFLAKAVAVAVGPARTVADFGCGEGYYLDIVMRATGADVFGTDISKPAIAAAARAYPEAQFVVADTNKFIPLADGSMEAGMCVFAPRNVDEFARVIAPGGRLVVVIPGAEHLAALREQFGLIGIEADKSAKIATQLTGAFKLESRQELAGAATLDNESLRDLIGMTPNARHMDDDKLALLEAAKMTAAEFRFELLLFNRLND